MRTVTCNDIHNEERVPEAVRQRFIAWVVSEKLNDAVSFEILDGQGYDLVAEMIPVMGGEAVLTPVRVTRPFPPEVLQYLPPEPT